ncbi:MAG: hydrogenase expression/formation protein HypE [Candidatus Omnitrophica bacterium]|nr:hydrogenase expression/formation protein HypE [Candidatus Omnitrophota bacterium]MDD5487716.1 hydrogenase expression/formation protein HypE [Candidatus Omnitrophota bacterium]
MKDNSISDGYRTCPVPVSSYKKVLLGHGSGGKLTNDLISSVFMRIFDSPELDTRHDGAVMSLGGEKIAMTTDSYVVTPLFFPGGDIGSLAVHGTVNDLAMCGARARFMTAGFIIEEGLDMEVLEKVAASMKRSCDEAGVRIVAGDTKVVEKGKGDGLFINTSGVGTLMSDEPLLPSGIKEGDAIVISGDVGRHGIAIMSAREGLALKTSLESDSALLSGMVEDLISEGVNVHCLRDLTRGGLASALIELSSVSGTGMRIDEAYIPVSEEVKGVCEILGLDPLQVANEGRFICFVPAGEAEKTIKILSRHNAGRNACRIGHVDGRTSGVYMRNLVGTIRKIDMLTGEQLPRIC